MVDAGNKISSGGKEKGLLEKVTKKCARKGEEATKDGIQRWYGSG